MLSALFSSSVFIFLTSTYFLTKFFLFDRHKGPKGMGSNLLALFYILMVIGSQIFINVQNSAEHCNGTPQVITSFIYTIIPNFFILGLVMILMKVVPGWKAPFSNTIGYFVVYMLGVNNVFTDLLKTKGSPLMQKIFDNKSMVINEITPFNFDLFMSRMNKDKLLKAGYKSKSAYETLYKYVVAKDSIAEFLWLVLTGALVISTTYNALLEITCDIPTAQRKAAAAKFEAEQAKTTADTPDTKFFAVQD